MHPALPSPAPPSRARRRRARRWIGVGLSAAVAAITVVSISFAASQSNASTASTLSTASTASTASYAPPSANAQFDYQIGEAYPPPVGVTVVSRDRNATPATGLYNICYVNAFQTQPDEIAWWQANHDDLLLKRSNGAYVVDGAWGEILLDVSTPAKRSAVASIVNGWIDGCASDGFQAVEPDNLDSWTRSDGLLTQANAEAFAALLTAHGHAMNLAVAQKNTTDLASAGREIGFDFAIAEECGRYRECDVFAAEYGSSVIVIEYRRKDFRNACTGWGTALSIVLRDVNVTAPGSRTYAYDSC
jgi:Glycoside-hydrolase family GH114